MIKFFLHCALIASVLCLACDAGSLQAQSAENLKKIYNQKESSRLVPLLQEALRFPTVKGNAQAISDQRVWLHRVGGESGLTVRDAGMVTELELPGPPDAPVLGLVVHGDVQPVTESEWTFPPFAGIAKDGVVYGRGAADDKGPLVQAILAMKSIRESGLKLTYTIRLLVGSDEESDNLDIATYLKDHTPPDFSLVLDSGFPVVVGEKAWNALTVNVDDPYSLRPGAAANAGKFAITHLEGGLATSIVPSRASVTLSWPGDSITGFQPAVDQIKSVATPEGYKLNVNVSGREVTITARGRAAHAGVNIEGGRNAIVFLAHTLQGKIIPSGAADILDFAAQAGQDLHGTGLGLDRDDPLWGRYDVNIATIQTSGARLSLTINIRRIPPMTGPQLKQYLAARVDEFNQKHGAHFAQEAAFYDDEPLAFNPNSRLVKRLLADYARATGENARPAISGGGTYAKRLPRSIAFGMWFPGQPYPGHDVDEHITVSDLQKGVHVLLEALVDLASSEPLQKPFDSE